MMGVMENDDPCRRRWSASRWHAEPARAGGGSDRHGQDQDPAADGRADLRRRRTVFARTSRATCPVSPARAADDKLLARTAGIGQDWPHEFFALGGQGRECRCGRR